MQAIILAAGMGRRLKELTQNNTKCMVKVNGVTLIERMLHQLEAKHLSRIVIVIGYEAEKLINFIGKLGIKTPICYVVNSIYDKTNNIYSLALAKEYLRQEDTILFESDIIFEDAVLDELINDSRSTLALVDHYEAWMDGTCLVLDEEDHIVEFVSKDRFDFDKKEQYYKTVNIYKFDRSFSKKYYVPFLEAYQNALGENEYYEQVLRVISMLDKSVIMGKKLSGQKWYEIDDVQDLDIASTIFASSPSEKMELIQRRYGGYWRFPHMLDFCYLVNPFFPTKHIMDEIKASFEELLTQYPSGMRINSLVAAKNFSIRQDQIVVGNGAAELIKAVMASFNGKTGFIRPTFEEYPNRYATEESIFFVPTNDDYQYSSNDVISFFEKYNIDNLVLINPDNPSGNYISQKDLLKLIEWTKKKAINFIVDESFVDFANEEDASLINTEILSTNRQLFVVKSISKSFGIPGLRIGILASGNVDVISNIKSDVSIWNINSFAEYYLQIYEKYQKDYKKALEKFKEERAFFEEELRSIEGIDVVHSEANYFMVKILSRSSKEITEELLWNDNILVKDLSSKLNGKNYIRIAVRDRKDNKLLIDALRKIF